MQQKRIAKYLKMIVLGVCYCAVLGYAVVLPIYGQGVASRYPEFSHAFWPWLIYLWVTAVPVAWALVLAWGMFDRIGKGESFSHANVKALHRIGMLALVDTAYFFLGQVVLLLCSMSHPGILLVSLLVVFVGLAAAAVCFALSALTKSAVQLREENELTI